MYQWNRIENSKINLLIYGQLIYNKGAKNIPWEKDSLFNKWHWENWTAIHRRKKLDNNLKLHTKINSKCSKDLHTRLETIKLLGRNVSKQLNISHGNYFLDFTPKAKISETTSN